MQLRPISRVVRAVALLSVCAGCVADPSGNIAPAADQGLIVIEADGRCSGREVIPAVIETVTEQVVGAPAILNEDGSVRSPASFTTVTRQEIVRERREQRFEAVCQTDLTPQFVASLQRALMARGGFNGPVNGIWSAELAAAVRRWQVARGGPDAPILALATAQQLGLTALSDEQLDA